MELIRPEFLNYIEEIRKSLLKIQPQLTTAKAVDEIDCIDRILCLIEAEHSYLAEHEESDQALAEETISLLAPLMSRAEMAPFKCELSALENTTWENPANRLYEYHNLLVRTIPALSQLADTGNEEASKALQRIISRETLRYRDIHQRRQRFFDIELPRPAEPGAGGSGTTDVGELEAYLRRIFTDEPALTVEHLHNIPGGRSKDTTLIALGNVHRLPAKIVMRRDIPGGLVPSKTVDEYAVLKVVEQYGGVPIPTPLHCERNERPLGGTFMLMSAVAGEAKGAYNPDIRSRLAGPDNMDRPRIGHQLATILAKLHQIPATAFTDTHLDLGVDPMAYVRETIEGTYRQATSFDSPSRVHIEAAYQWLIRNLALAEDQPCLIHCDVGLHNLLVEDDNITALLDWELACFASPARELSKILHLIDYLMPREEFFQAYLEAGGPANACEPDRLRFYAVMNYMVTNQRARYANHLFMTGQQANIVMANAGFDSCYRVTSLLANALQEAYNR